MWRLLIAIFNLSIGNPVPIKPKPAPELVPVPVPIVPIPVIVKTMPEKIYDFAKACLGKDIAATQNELGCAESISYIFKHVGVREFPAAGYLGTGAFYTWLKVHAQQVTIPSPGDVIISPTGTSTKGAQHGHIGIVGLHGILSNNSMNGLFQEYYTTELWKRYYSDKLGFPTLYYRIK